MFMLSNPLKVGIGEDTDSFYMHRRKLVTDEIASIYQYRTSMHSVKPSEDKKEQKGRQSHLQLCFS